MSFEKFSKTTSKFLATDFVSADQYVFTIQTIQKELKIVHTSKLANSAENALSHIYNSKFQIQPRRKYPISIKYNTSTENQRIGLHYKGKEENEDFVKISKGWMEMQMKYNEPHLGVNVGVKGILGDALGNRLCLKIGDEDTSECQISNLLKYQNYYIGQRLHLTLNGGKIGRKLWEILFGYTNPFFLIYMEIGSGMYKGGCGYKLGITDNSTLRVGGKASYDQNRKRKEGEIAIKVRSGDIGLKMKIDHQSQLNTSFAYKFATHSKLLLGHSHKLTHLFTPQRNSPHTYGINLTFGI